MWAEIERHVYCSFPPVAPAHALIFPFFIFSSPTSSSSPLSFPRQPFNLSWSLLSTPLLSFRLSSHLISPPLLSYLSSPFLSSPLFFSSLLVSPLFPSPPQFSPSWTKSTVPSSDPTANAKQGGPLLIESLKVHAMSVADPLIQNKNEVVDENRS